MCNSEKTNSVQFICFEVRIKDISDTLKYFAWRCRTSSVVEW